MGADSRKYEAAADNITTKLQDLLRMRALECMGKLAATQVLSEFNEHVHSVFDALAKDEDLPAPR